MNIKNKISLWIRSSRKEAGFSGDELGAKLAMELGDEKGHTKANISHWELGRHDPSFRQILAISKVTKSPLPQDILFIANKINTDKQPQVKIHADTQALIDLMNSTDDRGKKKILSAAQDTWEIHEAHLRKIGQSSAGVSDQIGRIGNISRKHNKTEPNDDLNASSDDAT
jgi:transcriptional regulator with XRE-family HTH domain